MGIADGFVKFSIRKNFEKGVKATSKAAVAAGVTYLTKYTGVELTPEQQAGLMVALTGAIFQLSNYLKIKHPEKFGWL